MYRVFSDMSQATVPEGFPFKDNFGKICDILALIVYHVLLGEMESLYKGCDLPTLLESLVKSKQDWIEDQVRRIGEVIAEM